MRSSSPIDSAAGSHTTPPLEPPNGMFTSAHFQVIQAASAFTSSSVTLRSNRIPPLAGPREVLRSEEHTSELQSLTNLVCRLLLEKKKSDYVTRVFGEELRRVDLR